MIHFDHIEVHVNNPSKYATFLKKLFAGGRHKKISTNGTLMFLSNDGLRIEIKKNKVISKNSENEIKHGFQLPCLRMIGVKKHLSKIKEVKIDFNIVNPDGKCYFFTDHEGIKWHFKDYQILDQYVNI